MGGQYYFGARTGCTNILEGILEVSMGLFMAGSIASHFTAFPRAIIGAMMLLVGVEMVKFARDSRWNMDLVSLGVTVAVSVTKNMALGFVFGIAAYYLVRWITKRAGKTPPTA